MAMANIAKLLQAALICKGNPLQSILLDVGGASHMDTTAAEAIKEWRQQFERAGVYLALIDPSPQITLMLKKAGVLDTGIACTFLLVWLSSLTKVAPPK